MRTATATAPARPTLAPLRAFSDVLDEVEGDLESIQRDLVLAERAGGALLAVAALAVAGVVAVVVVRRLRGRGAVAVPDTSWPPVPPAPRAAAPDASDDPPVA